MTGQILVYDIGTTSVKTILFGTDGRETESISIPYKTSYRQQCVEQDPEDFWKAAIIGTQNLSEISKSMVLGIGISGHMNGALCIGKQGQSIRPELIHSDTRSTEECNLLRKIQPKIYQINGNRVDEHLSLPKIYWIYRHEKETYERTAFFVNAKDYVRTQLTGIVGETDFSDASLSCCLDMHTREWDSDLLTSLGLDPNRFPTLKKSTELGGYLTKEASALLGLQQGIPVAMGAGDAACATRGAGIKDTDRAYACIGSSAWISTLGTQILADKEMRLQHFFDLDGLHINVCGTVQCTGIAFDWILKTLGLERQKVERHLSNARPGSEGILFAPYLLGDRSPFWDSKARGSFVGLSLSQSPLDIAQSVYEGVSFALKNVLDVYAELGFTYESLTVTGGVARSLSYVQMLANVLGKTLKTQQHPTQGSGFGAAIAAMVAVGFYHDLDEAIDQMIVKENCITPESLKASQYDELYPIFRKLYKSEKPINDALYRIWNKDGDR
ncbi:pentulose/hexulose kinase [Sphaerochaeta pleomorpha str. Grapes]|uniref:Pentulose/hexulose kinase n=1 Tax=Sphaerochaeta pleomorpha (strain ATCC BAA-1885 / DSM 22778 / Grapes) TaxID=158190 RepID=G8QSV4_SPHPG|nr:FGGY family carbohydrate kinase [Sphaerochaeta pleomorpha]AEV30136.1 pentulose/hexulose kinase [Sphaerochaeta pleomorpha str. Grapes]